MRKRLSWLFLAVICAVAWPSMAQMARKSISSTEQSTARSETRPVTERAVNPLTSGMTRYEPPRRQKRASGIRPVAQGTATGAPLTGIRQGAVAGMPTIYGSVVFSYRENHSIGLYTVPNGDTTVPELYIKGPNATYGGVCVDGIYYATNYMNLMGIAIITVEAYDMETKTLIGPIETDDRRVMGTTGYALDPTTGNVYGITYKAQGSGVQLTILDFSVDNVSFTDVAPMTGVWNSIAFDKTGQLYGIRNNGTSTDHGFVVDSATLCKIDKTNGAVTEVGQLGVHSTYLSSSCIDPRTNRMFWNVILADDTGYMYEINLQTAETTLLYQLDYADEIMGMFIPVPTAEDLAPDEVENVNIEFNEGSLSGTCTFKTPSRFFNGTTGTGAMTVHVHANDVEVASASAGWGQDVSLDVTVPQAGNYTFKIFASNSTGNGPTSKIRNVWVGNDTPAAPTATLEYSDGMMNVSWPAVEGTVNGGWLDTSSLTYTVVRNADDQSTQVATGLTGTTFSEPIEPTDGHIINYSYSVYAVTGDLTSGAGTTNEVVLGYYTPPYNSDFGNNGFEGWTIIDANEDDVIWRLDGNLAKITYNSRMAMDDYLITPPLMLSSEKSYKLKFKTYAHSINYAERLEVLMGQAPTAEAMTQTIVGPTDVMGNNPIDYDKLIIPSTTGTYYIGFHGISDEDKFNLYLRDVVIEEVSSDLLPGETGNLTLTPDPNGALTVDISFTAPTTTISGTPLSSLQKVELYRGDEVIKTYDTPAPGATLTFKDEVPRRSSYTYGVTGYNEEGKGLKTTAAVFIGFDKPKKPENVSISRTDTEGEVTISWDAVTADLKEKPMPEGEITYKVETLAADGTWTLLAENLTSTTYTWQAVPAGQQDFVQVAIYAVNSVDKGMGAVSDMIPAGKPYEGLKESAAGATLSYNWSYIGHGNASVEILSEKNGILSQDGDGYYIGINGRSVDSGADFLSGLVSLEGIYNPTLSFYTYDVAKKAAPNDDGTIDPDINEITVEVRTDDNVWNQLFSGTVEEICAGSADGWGLVSIPLQAYAGKKIQFCIKAVTKIYVYTTLDNITVGPDFDHDLQAVKVTAPEKAVAGSTFKTQVEVANIGNLKADNYTVELYVDGTLHDTKPGVAIESEATGINEFIVTMPALATKTMRINAKVVYESDQDDSNNTTPFVKIKPEAPVLPGATDLTGQSLDEGVKLTWNAPALEPGTRQEITQDFEDAEPWADHYGDWTFYDLDDSPLGGAGNYNIPTIIPTQTKGSFWVWDTDELAGDSETFAAHSGSKYLFSLYRYDEKTVDDWAVSPELWGDAQKISFYAKSINTLWPETIRVLYNTVPSTDPETFTEVIVEPTVLSREWTLIEAELPAGALHFAINTITTDGLMMMLDDVTFTPSDGVSNLVIAGYDIYRDGEKINQTPVQACEWLDTNVTDGTSYKYIVTTLYEGRDQGILSNELSLVYTLSGVSAIGNDGVSISAKDGCVIVKNASGLPVSVAAPNGAVIYSGTGNVLDVIRTGRGIFLVQAGNTVRKLIVR